MLKKNNIINPKKKLNPQIASNKKVYKKYADIKWKDASGQGQSKKVKFTGKNIYKYFIKNNIPLDALKGANLSGMDLRGTVFGNRKGGCDLSGVDVSDNKSGCLIRVVSNKVFFAILIATVFLSFLLMFLIPSLSVIINYFHNTDEILKYYRNICLIVFFVLSTVLYRFISFTFFNYLGFFAFIIIVTVSASSSIVPEGFKSIELSLGGLSGLMISFFIIGSIILCVFLSNIYFIIFSLICAIIINYNFFIVYTSTIIKISRYGLIVACILSLLFLIITYSTIIKARQGDKRFITLLVLETWVKKIGATSFRNCFLRDVNFSNSIFKGGNFAKAEMIRCNFKDVKGLELVWASKSIISDFKVRDLLVTGNGKNNSYRSKNMNGAYLNGADMKGCDLSLVNAVGASFKDTNITGACIEEWNIEHAQLNGIKCDYAYTSWSADKNQWTRRIPPSGKFGKDEFGKLCQDAEDTLEFIFSKNFDLSAFVQTLREVQTKNDRSILKVKDIKERSGSIIISTEINFKNLKNVNKDTKEKVREDIYLEIKNKYESKKKLEFENKLLETELKYAKKLSKERKERQGNSLYFVLDKSVNIPINMKKEININKMTGGNVAMRDVNINQQNMQEVEEILKKQWAQMLQNTDMQAEILKIKELLQESKDTTSTSIKQTILKRVWKSIKEASGEQFIQSANSKILNIISKIPENFEYLLSNVIN